MLRIETTPDKSSDKRPIVRDISFPLPLERGFSDPRAFGKVDHEEIAARLHEEAEAFASVVVSFRTLKEDLYEDPRYVHITNEITVSEARAEARRRMMNNHWSQDDIDDMIKKFELPAWRQNYGDDAEEENRNFRTELQDAFFEAQESMILFDIMEELKEECRIDYNEETGEERQRSDEEGHKEWDRVRLEQSIPHVSPEYQRVLNMPEPLSHWDSRNRTQQWFFVQNKDAIKYFQGGSGSSQQRETMGRYAHVFATLARRFGVGIPTTVLLYDEVNALRLIDSYDTFKAVDEELTGNYKADREQKDQLFAGMLLVVRYDSREVVPKDQAVS
jgi:hypothetical protein